jgi:hypothetical protein
LEDPGAEGKDNFKMVIQEMGCVGMECINLDQDWDMWRHLQKKSCNEPSGSIKCGEFLD